MKSIRLVVAILIAWVFHAWFQTAEIIGGDWPYYFPETLEKFTLYPSLWASWHGNGLGGINLLLGLHLFQTFLIIPFTQWIHIPWPIVYKVGWFGLFIGLSAYSSWRLTRSLLGVLMYLVNTYALMLVSGGQMGVALAYAVAPLVLESFVHKRHPVISGLLLGFQMMIDLRLSYVTLVGAALFGVTRLVVPVAIALGVNAFWLLPQIFLKTNPVSELGSAYTSIASVKFLSFADFSHALTLLHPNWPENMFGKTRFLQPEFLIIPILAFARLFSQPQVRVALLGLIGVFLAKGANGPFGGVYLWLFERVPGFVMFRDPTKWLLLVILSYSVLIPSSLGKAKKYGMIISIAFVMVWIGLHRQAFLGQLPGTFVPRSVPAVYEFHKAFIANQPEYFRTLWVPRQSRFSFATPLHPAMEAEPLFGATDSATLSVNFGKPETQTLLKEYGVAYVVVPHDALGELFVTDREYDERKRRSYKAVLDAVPWLTKIQDDELTVYKTPGHNDLFWSDAGQAQYKPNLAGGYEVMLSSKSQLLYFSQRFHPGWRIRTSRGELLLPKEHNNLMIFDIPDGTTEALVYFEPQQYVTWGMLISALTLLLSLIVYNRREKHI